MIVGFSVPLQWPEDAAARREMERQVLQMAAMMAAMPRELDAQLPPGGRETRARLARELLRHWPPGPGRPPEVVRLAARYGEGDGPGGDAPAGPAT